MYTATAPHGPLVTPPNKRSVTTVANVIIQYCRCEDRCTSRLGWGRVSSPEGSRGKNKQRLHHMKVTKSADGIQ